jgi:toxin-antitoxin system PIN domain toxin
VFVVDTNILVYSVNTTSPFHETCAALLEELRPRPDAWFGTWGILYEFVRLTTHPRTMRRPWSARHAWEFVDGLLESPGFALLRETDRHHAVATQLIVETPGLAGNAMHHAHIAILMREHGIRTIYTRDTGFHRFRSLNVIDPIATVGDRPGTRGKRSPATRRPRRPATAR